MLTPAFRIMPSTLLKDVIVFSTKELHAFRSVMSVGTAITLPPADLISLCILFSLSSFRAANTALAPCAAKPFAKPSPMPDEAPVIMNVEPEIWIGYPLNFISKHAVANSEYIGRIVGIFQIFN